MSSRSRLTLAALSLSFALCNSALTAKPTPRSAAVAHPVAAVSLWEALTAKLGSLLSGTCDNRGGVDPWGCLGNLLTGTCDSRGSLDPWGCPSAAPTTNDAPACDSRGGLDPWGCASR